MIASTTRLFPFIYSISKDTDILFGTEKMVEMVEKNMNKVSFSVSTKAQRGR